MRIVNFLLVLYLSTSQAAAAGREDSIIYIGNNVYYLLPAYTSTVCISLYGCITPVLYVYVDFPESLDLQWDNCSDQLTLTCTHSEAQTDPSWVYHGTLADGVSLDNIPGAEYTESTSTRHVGVISGMDNVRAVDSFTFQCGYNLVNNNQVRSNKEQYYWGKLTH